MDGDESPHVEALGAEVLLVDDDGFVRVHAAPLDVELQLAERGTCRGWIAKGVRKCRLLSR